MNGNNLLQHKVSGLEAATKDLLIMGSFDALLVKLEVTDGCQALLINEVQLVKSGLYPLSFVKLDIGQNP